MDQLKRNAIECLRSLHRDDVLNQRDEHASSRGNVITTKGSSPCKTSSSSPAVLKKSIMPMKKRIFAEIDCDLPSTQKRMKNGHDLTVISSCVGNKKNGIPTTISSDSCSTRQEKPLYDAEKRSIMSVKNQKQTKQENNHSVPKKTLDTGIERQDGKGIDEKNKREEVLEGSSPSPVVLQEYSYFKHGRVNCNKFPVKLMDILESGLHDDTIVWASNGKAFAIVKPDKLIKEILPQYIENSKIMKFKSFVRKLYRWRFSKVMALSKEDAKLSNVLYVNKQFIKGRRDLCEKIECSSSLSRYERERKKFISSVEIEQKHPHFHNDYSTSMTPFHMTDKQDIPLTRVSLMIAPQSSQISFRSEDRHERNVFSNHVNLSQNKTIGDHYVRSNPSTVGHHHNVSSNILPSSSILFNTQNVFQKVPLNESCVLPQHENLNYFCSNRSNIQSMGNGYMSYEEVPMQMQMQTPRQQMFCQAFANSRQDGSLSMGFTYPSNSMNAEEMYNANHQMEMRLKMQRPQLFPRGM